MAIETRIFELESGEEIINPPWSEVEVLLDRTDGQQETYGALHIPGIGRLVVGGGQTRKWLVYFEPEDKAGAVEEFPTAIDWTLGDAPVELIICGVSSVYPAYKCVGKDKVLLAFKCFYNSGTLAEELEWVSHLVEVSR